MEKNFKEYVKLKNTIKNGNNFKVEFIDMSHDGQGICKIDGVNEKGEELQNFPIFVPLSVKGDQGIIELTNVKKDFASGKIVKIFPDKKSPSRTTPRCEHYPECGGCSLMHLTYSAQLEFKENMVKATLARLGGITDVEVNPIIGMIDPWFYRNKVQIPVGMERHKTVAGFYRANSHDIIPLQSCYIQSKEMTEIFKFIKNLFNEFGIKGYDEKRHFGDVRHVLLRESATNKEIMVVLVTMKEHLPNLEEFCQKLIKRHPSVVSIVINVNKDKTNEILGKYTKTIYGKREIEDELLGMKFLLGAKSFYQVNHEQTEVLYQQVLNIGKFNKDDIVIDAYSGIGTIGMLIAPHVKQVYSVEVIPDAIRNSIENAKRNQIENISFVCNAAEAQIVEWSKEGINATTIVVDPPRKGCDETLLQTIVDMNIPKMIYVSCNPATLARDLRFMVDHNYQILEVQPLDMFPQTVHVETVVLMSKVQN